VSSELSQGIAQIEHVALATKRLESLCDFYRRLGGVALPLARDPGDGLPGFVLDFCGVRLEVFERPRSGRAAAGAGRSSRLLHLGFALGSADAVDELSRVLAAAGHPVLESPHRAGELGRYGSVVLDPTATGSSSASERRGDAGAWPAPLWATPQDARTGPCLRCGGGRRARAHDELVTAGARPRRDPTESRSNLTASELRVARLAALFTDNLTAPP
jgi:lactoylglutathione lyase